MATVLARFIIKILHYESLVYLGLLEILQTHLHYIFCTQTATRLQDLTRYF